MYKLGVSILIALISTGTFCFGFLYAEPTVEIREVEIPVEVRVEVPVEIPIELREFRSESELESWIANRDKTITIISGTNFMDYDCDDIARTLVRQARVDGYDVWIQWVGDHWLCMTTIGNDIYFIEPQTNEFWKAGELD